MLCDSQAIESEGLDGVAVLVTRYFGGVKLGAGGLVRAYGNAARTCLRAARRITVKARVQVQVSAPYEVRLAPWLPQDHRSTPASCGQITSTCMCEPLRSMPHLLGVGQCGS